MRKSSTRALTMLATLPVFGITVFGIRPVVTTPPASAAVVSTWHRGACKGTAGVTVVVDFTDLGGKIKVHCDTGTPKTGLDALKGAGFTYSFVPGIPGFVCRIDSLPNPCNGAPASAYWAYWHAKAHGTWILSNKGAGSFHPRQGTVQGWAFGASEKPGIAPPN